MIATFTDFLSYSAVFIAPPPHVICNFLFSKYSGWRCALLSKSKHSSLACLSIFLQCFHFCNVFPLYGFLSQSFHLMYGETLDLPHLSPPLSPPPPKISPGGCFTISSISFPFWLINCCINFSMVDTLASVWAFICWMISQVAAAISSCCYVAFSAFPYPTCLAYIF